MMEAVLDDPFFYTTFLLGVACVLLFLALLHRENKRNYLPEPSPRFVHLKSGHIYVKKGIAISATNSSSGQGLVIYHHVDNPRTLYAREETEFLAKFKELTFPQLLPKRNPSPSKETHRA